MTTKKILVLDCGRTNERFYLLSLEGETLAHFWGTGTYNPGPDPKITAQRFQEAAESLVERLGGTLPEILVAVAGLAGYGREEDCRALEEALAKGGSPFPWLVESDARQTLRAACEEGPVVVALLGTGSAFFARDVNGTIHRTGGHGAILEDHGSAFEVSRQAILAMMRSYDGMGPGSRLFSALLEKEGCRDALEFRTKVVQEGFHPSEWARFAPEVIQKAEEGDPTATKILTHQLEKVVDCLWALIHKAGLPSGTPIFCSGGMVEKSPYYLHLLQAAISRGLPDHPCSLVGHEPYWGGWRRACQWIAKSSQGEGQVSSTGSST